MPKRKLDNDQAKLSFGTSGILTLVKPPEINLPKPSQEQQTILDCVKYGNNVKIEADAGTSKTTTLLMLALHVPKLIGTYTLLTYGRALCDDTNTRIRKMNLQNRIVCKTIHSFAGSCAGYTIRDDKIMEEFITKLENGEYMKFPDASETFLLDEAQDMRPLYYNFLSKAMMHHRHQLVVVGDTLQRIYRGSSIEYLENPETCFQNCTQNPWKSLTLKISYRMTPNVCTFVNILWGKNTIPGNHTNPNLPVEYLLLPSFERTKTKIKLKIETLSDRAEQLIKEYGEHNIIFLANAVNTDKHVPFKEMINKLEGKFNFHLQSDGKTHNNKVRVWSYHGSKGLTVKCVVVLGFSAYKGRQPDRNPIAVACSRSCEKLVVIDQRDVNNGYFDFEENYPGNKGSNYVDPFSHVVLTNLIDNGTVIAPNGLPEDTYNNFKNSNDTISVTSLTRSCLQPHVYLRHASCILLQPPKRQLSYQMCCTFVSNDVEIEQDVSNLYGIGIPFKLEFDSTNKINEIEAMLNPLLIPELYNKRNKGTNKSYFIKELRKQVCLTQEENEILNSCDDNINEEGLVKFLQFNIKKLTSLQKFGITTKSRYDNQFKEKHREKVQNIYSKLRNDENQDNSDFIYLANASKAFGDVHHNLNQITNYEWVDKYSLDVACDFLKSWIGDVTCEFEEQIRYYFEPVRKGKLFDYKGISGRIDARSNDSLYEFKMVNEINDEHKLQAALYAAMWCINRKLDETKIHLVNGKTEEVIELSIMYDNAKHLIEDVSKTLEEYE